jgi:hypothetical protein
MEHQETQKLHRRTVEFQTGRCRDERGSCWDGPELRNYAEMRTSLLNDKSLKTKASLHQSHSYLKGTGRRVIKDMLGSSWAALKNRKESRKLEAASEELHGKHSAGRKTNDYGEETSCYDITVFVANTDAIIRVVTCLLYYQLV